MKLVVGYDHMHACVQVLELLPAVVKAGPVRCATAFPRAALALSPTEKTESVMRSIVHHCMETLRTGTADAIHVVPMLCAAALDHTSQDASWWDLIVTRVLDTLLFSCDLEDAACRPGAALTIYAQVIAASFLRFARLTTMYTVLLIKNSEKLGELVK